MRLKIFIRLKDLLLHSIRNFSYRYVSMIFVTFLFIAYMKVLVYYYARAEHQKQHLKADDTVITTTQRDYETIAKKNIFLDSVVSIDEYLRQLSELNRHLSEQNSDDSLHALLSISKFKSTRLLFPEVVSDITKLISGNDLMCERSSLGSELTLLIIVCVSVENFQSRKLIRDTWARGVRSRQNAKLLFVVANTNNTTANRLLAEEIYAFKDIVQFGFYDSSYNATLKSLAVIRWTLLHCPLVKYLLKVDERTLINFDQLLNYLTSKYDNESQMRSIYGEIAKRVTVSRSPADTKYISVDDYPHNIYPNFVRNNYLIPGSLLMPLYETAIVDALPALQFDDIYLTGIVAQKAFISISDLPQMFSLRTKQKSNYCNVRKYFVLRLDWNGSDNVTEIRGAWSRFSQKNVRCVVKKKNSNKKHD